MPSRICTKSFNALSLQADYVKSPADGCFAMLRFSLSCFSFQRLDAGCLALVGFFAAFVSTITSWNTCNESCRSLCLQTADAIIRDVNGTETVERTDLTQRMPFQQAHPKTSKDIRAINSGRS
jgi:hypothetical protein